MSKLAAILKSRLFLAFLGIVFLSIFIWFAGPMLGFNGQAPLETKANRYIAIGGMSALWFLSIIFRFIKSRRKNSQLLDSLAQEVVSPEDAASAEEYEILQNKIQSAISTLKSKNFTAKGGSRFIYELPWYTIIGPPGAGKTTLLSNSGLDFPLEDSHGKFSVKGVGGTRNCDWWFTDQAVLLDTAGRYLTQDSEAEVDKAAWTNFLKLLREKRKRRPINGVLVAVSVQDIIQSDNDSLLQLAHTVRTRVDELYENLGIAPPVYLIFTKCDLMAGFSEFFSALDQRGREQVWGFTLPLEEGTDQNEQTEQRLSELVTTIGDQAIDRLHRELSQRNRELIYSFPMQFSALQPKILQFSSLLTARSKLLENVLFRGMYFTSATQTGNILDEVIAKVSRNFGMSDYITAPQSDSGKSYFIKELLTGVVFKEAGLAGMNIKVEKRLARLQVGAAGLLGVCLLTLSVVWVASFFDNREALARVSNDSQTFASAATSLPDNSLDLFATNSMLTGIEQLNFNPRGGIPDESDFLARRTGLYQGNQISEVVGDKYKELLIDALLPRLMVRLEHQMHSEANNNEFLFEALKAYQMIDSREHFDKDTVVTWFNYDFDNNLPPDTPTKIREELKHHVALLFKEKPYRLPRPLDQATIAQFRQIAATVTTEQRAYNRIRNATRGDVNPFYRLSEHASPDIALVFTRSDNTSLDQSIPGFFTVEGYRNVFLPESKNISKTLAEDGWVLGNAISNSSDQSNDELLEAVRQKYFDEYILHWESLIEALQLKSIAGLQQASAFIALLSDSESPLKKLLITISEQTTLTQPENDEETDAQSSSKLADLLKETLNPSSSVQNIVESTAIDAVTLHFSKVHKLVADWENNGSQLDQTLNQLAEINLQLLPMAQSPAGSLDPTLNIQLAVTLQQLDTKAGRLPEPIASLVKSLSSDIGDVVGGGTCQQLDTIWKTEVHAYYQKAIRGRYPVNRNATADIALADFGAFFGPGGIVDSFVNKHLSTFVSKTPGQWTWVGKESSVCVSDKTLKQLAFADDIKNTFFSLGGQTPSFRFDLVPDQVKLSVDIDDLFLDIADQRMRFSHGQIAGTTVYTWPGNNTQVSLRAEPVVPGTTSSGRSASGPWAALRLFDQGSRDASSGRLTVSYNLGGRNATLVFATSSFNPLNSVALRNFNAPENL